MSATGQNGLSIIVGTTHDDMSPVLIPDNGGFLLFTHNVGRVAYQVIITDDQGNVVNNAVPNFWSVSQTVNAIRVQNNSVAGSTPVYIAPRWEENTVELSTLLDTPIL